MFDLANAKLAVSRVTDLDRKVTLLEGQLRSMKVDLAAGERDLVLCDRQQKVKMYAANLLKRGLEKGTGTKVKVEGIVSHGLSVVFEDDIRAEFDVELKGKSNRLSVTPKILTKRGEKWIKTNVMGSRGGSIVNVFSFLMRVIALLAVRPKLRPFMVIDEGFANVSDGYLDNVGVLLKEFVARMNGQIVLVTHKQALARCGDKVYRVRQIAGKTQLFEE